MLLNAEGASRDRTDQPTLSPSINTFHGIAKRAARVSAVPSP
jgi:hypothetical protein